ncbi:MAG: helix-turn-helix domain-containing protein [Desulfohalobiaceae bacterium]
MPVPVRPCSVARRLGITRATLHSKIKKYDLADR